MKRFKSSKLQPLTAKYEVTLGFVEKIRNLPEDCRVIDIEIELNDLTSIDSANRVEHKQNIAKKDRFTAEQLQWYNDLIDNIYDMIDTYFKIIDAYQSSHSYSYYLEFEASIADGTSLGNFTIKFRISNHEEKAKTSSDNAKSNSGPTSEQVKKGWNRIFRSILVNEVSQKGMVDTVQTMSKICEQLLEGNLDILDMLCR